MFKKIILIVVLLLAPYAGLAATSACNPQDVKPVKEDTSLATTFSVKPDIVAVGQLMTLQVKDEGLNNVGISINVPTGTELVDFSPKTINNKTIKPSIRSVDWNASGAKIPQDSYSITVKVNKWTKKTWQVVEYSATSDLGTGYGSNSFFAYYDTVPLEITIDERNQAPQNSQDVIRKVLVKGAPEAQINLKTSSGSLGPTISENSGPQTNDTANSDGEISAFLFTKENAKISLTASSLDSCQDSTITQQFKITKSDVARTYTNYAWIWWLAALIAFGIIIAIIIIIRRKKQKSDLSVNESFNQPTDYNSQLEPPETKDNHSPEI